MTDPYKILGVSSDASDDEIKTAYRTLAGKYQQEIQLQTPQAQWAEQKMKELDEAYDFIIASRRSQKPPVNNSYYQSSTDDYHDIRMKISSGRIEDAEVILDGIPEMQRNAEWHFLKGTVQYKRGWLEEAYNRFSTACNMDPSNKEYKAAFNRLEQQRSGGYRPMNVPVGCTVCDCCTSLICADCCCDCIGGNSCC